MQLYLMRHGKANPEEVDPEQGLSEGGKEGVKKLAEELKKQGTILDLILVSSKKRSKQTGEIVAEQLGLSKDKIQKTDMINPNTEPQQTIDFLKTLTKNSVLIAGHLPLVEKIANYFLGVNGSIAFHNATCCLIDINTFESGHAALIWTKSP